MAFNSLQNEQRKSGRHNQLAILSLIEKGRNMYFYRCDEIYWGTQCVNAKSSTYNLITDRSSSQSIVGHHVPQIQTKHGYKTKHGNTFPQKIISRPRLLYSFSIKDYAVDHSGKEKLKTCFWMSSSLRGTSLFAQRPQCWIYPGPIPRSTEQMRNLVLYILP